MGTAVGIPTGENAFCLWQRMCPELFCQPAKEELLALLDQVQLGSLEFSLDSGRRHLTPALGNTPRALALASAALGDQIQDHARV